MSLLDLREDKNVLVVSIAKSRILDEASIEQIGLELNDCILKAPDEKIVVNFGKVTFMSSAMIGKLIVFNNKCTKANVNLKLCAISDNVMEVFKIMRLNKVFDIRKTEVDALGSQKK